MRTMLRIFAVLLLFGGLAASAVAGYVLFAPSDEKMLSEQKYKEMAEKHERAQAARNPSERAHLLKESEAAASSASVWDEGARARRRGVQLGLGAGCVVVLFSF